MSIKKYLSAIFILILTFTVSHSTVSVDSVSSIDNPNYVKTVPEIENKLLNKIKQVLKKDYPEYNKFDILDIRNEGYWGIVSIVVPFDKE